MASAAAISIVKEHFTASLAATERLFSTRAPLIAQACRMMADRFAAGGTLFVAARAAQASDAHHVAVEFVHPVIVGKRALPTVALTGDFLDFAAWPPDGAPGEFVDCSRHLINPSDMVLVLASERSSPSLEAVIGTARSRGALVLAVRGPTPADSPIEIDFAIDDPNPLLVQEAGETLYHVLWELVHVFLEAGDAAETSFLPASAAPTLERLTEAVTASAREKGKAANVLRQALLDGAETRIGEAACVLAARLRSGGRVLAFGNGGSATDAHDAAVDCLMPAFPGWRRIPAQALSADAAIVTAIGNDVGFERVFARQLAAYATGADAALAFSTSGASRNLLAGMAEARRRGLLTIAMSGGDGGELSRSPDVDFCFTAPGEHLPRIQEAHATAWHALLTATQEALRA
jgi:D-sedoheptulose 7-phosphate isomerase